MSSSSSSDEKSVCKPKSITKPISTTITPFKSNYISISDKANDSSSSSSEENTKDLESIRDSNHKIRPSTPYTSITTNNKSKNFIDLIFDEKERNISSEAQRSVYKIRKLSKPIIYTGSTKVTTASSSVGKEQINTIIHERFIKKAKHFLDNRSSFILSDNIQYWIDPPQYLLDFIPYTIIYNHYTKNLDTGLYIEGYPRYSRIVITTCNINGRGEIILQDTSEKISEEEIVELVAIMLEHGL